MSKHKQAELPLNEVSIIRTPIINTHYKKVNPPGQVNKMPHMTIPDMSMPLVELIDRFASGILADIGQSLYYDGEGHEVEITDDVLLGVNWNSLDIVEKHAILKQTGRDFSKIQEGVKKGQELKAQELEKQRKAQEQRDKEFDEWRKSQKEKDQGS